MFLSDSFRLISDSKLSLTHSPKDPWNCGSEMASNLVREGASAVRRMQHTSFARRLAVQELAHVYDRVSRLLLGDNCIRTRRSIAHRPLLPGCPRQLPLYGRSTFLDYREVAIESALMGCGRPSQVLRRVSAALRRPRSSTSCWRLCFNHRSYLTQVK